MNILTKNLLILASAGSGKTFQLANRVIGLVAGGIEPEKIVALTFTRKAAGEFADSVLMKLARAASDGEFAIGLRRDLALQDADFSEALERVVRALPRFTLGTMDSFFSKVVRGFQYELGLTGGKFDLLEGSRAAAAADEILAAILGDTLEEDGGGDFLHSFRRATLGKEQQGVADSMRDFVKNWQSRYRSLTQAEWGPSTLGKARLEDWEIQKNSLASKARGGLDGVQYTRKGQREALEKLLDSLTEHTIGSGSLGSVAGLFKSLLENAVTPSGPLQLQYHKPFLVDGPAGDALRDMVLLAAHCELAAALTRTRAVRDVISVYDARCENQLRRRGMLGFDDVKILMGNWVTNEDARLRREAVDFRLDARYEHWLLDEFQDTSRADWMGLLPLIDEAAGEGEGSVFIVGDRKQAIYAWRGGEVELFDEVIDRYGGGMEISPMAESWRSCPEVLDLVNQVCGDPASMRELFGEAAAKWEWQAHRSAPPLAENAKRGEARVEVVEGKWEERLERLGELLVELGVGRREMTCGVLVRSNAMVRKVADELRAKGFDVIEEGRREPAKDNPVGIALAHLIKWLANPADAFAREVVAMSPLAGTLQARFGNHWQQVWEGLLDIASSMGFAGMIEMVFEENWATWSDFGRRRAGDIMTALASLDAQGGATPHEAAEWVERLEISQSPGIAAVQVMTIHKAKGLGFDVVIVPEIPNDSVPASQHFDVAAGDGWIAETPPKWARDLIPEMREAEAKWAVGQRYEAFCMLYVALTRSKRGLYVLLEPPAASQDIGKPSLANWLARSISSDGQPGVAYQSGTPDWIETIPWIARLEKVSAQPALAARIPRRERITPSRQKDLTSKPTARSPEGMIFGTEVHAVFERIGWIDESISQFPSGKAGRLVADILKLPELRSVFERKGRAIKLFREQAVDAIHVGQWLSGVIDRLHLHSDASGAVKQVEIIDFKTDPCSEIGELVKKYSSQISAYREVMQVAYPAAEVRCLILSTARREMVEW